MRQNDLKQIGRRKALKTIGSAGLATVGFSGSALASRSESETPGQIQIVNRTEKKVVLETESRGETLRITYFKQGPNAGTIHYQGGPQWLDGFQFDAAAAQSRLEGTFTQGTATPSYSVIDRQTRFRKKIGSCHAFNNYQHRFYGGSIVLTKNASLVGESLLGAIIGSIVPGGKIGFGVAAVTAFLIGKFGNSRSFTFGQRDFDDPVFHSEFSVSVAGYGFNLPASKTVPVNAPIPDHIVH